MYTINDLMSTPYALAMGPCMCGARPRHWPARGGPQAAFSDVFNISIFYLLKVTGGSKVSDRETMNTESTLRNLTSTIILLSRVAQLMM